MLGEVEFAPSDFHFIFSSVEFIDMHKSSIYISPNRLFGIGPNFRPNRLLSRDILCRKRRSLSDYLKRGKT